MGCPGAQAFSAASISFSRSAFPKTDVRKRGRQADVLTERENSCRFVRGCVCELEPRQNAKGDFFAVVERMGFRQCGETIVNGMGCRQSRAFKPDSAQQDVRLDNVIQSRRDDMPLTGDFSSRTIGQQCFITEFGDVESCPLCYTPPHSFADWVRSQDLASNQVDSASPIPATRKRVGAAAMIPTSTSTTAGFVF